MTGLRLPALTDVVRNAVLNMAVRSAAVSDSGVGLYWEEVLELPLEALEELELFEVLVLLDELQAVSAEVATIAPSANPHVARAARERGPEDLITAYLSFEVWQNSRSGKALGGTGYADDSAVRCGAVRRGGVGEESCPG